MINALISRMGTEVGKRTSRGRIAPRITTTTEANLSGLALTADDDAGDAA